MSSDTIIRASGLGKCHTIYDRPVDRLKQSLLGRWRRYGREFWALRDIDLSIRRGEVLGVIGRNGAGKSTLLQLLCGTLTPTTGELAVSGRVAALLELGAGFNPDFTGRENAYMNAAILGLSRAEVGERLDDIIAFADIGEFIDQPVRTYSSGMFVRLAFAIATSVEPDILVIDEALSVGDGAFARKSFDRIMRMREAGKTIVFCSHAMYHVETLCDEAVWLEHGALRMRGRASDVTAAYQASLNAGVAGGAAVSMPHAGSATAAAAGTGRILRIEAAVDGVAGSPLVARSGESELAVSVEFVIDPALPPPTLAVGFSDSNLVTVSSALSHLDGVQFAAGPDGRGQARVVFPRLPLLKGDYWLTLILVCERGMHAYDLAERAISFKVTQQGPEQGFVVLPHRWAT
jgi:lipopolysaccharide transport system ATP-binding protein